MEELPLVLSAAEKESTRIIPIVVRPCGFSRDKALSSFQAVNDPKTPIVSMNAAERENIYEKVAEIVEDCASKERRHSL